MAVVKNLMVRCGADFSALTTASTKAKASMTTMQSSVARGCASMQTAVSGLNRMLGVLGVSLSIAGIAAFAKSARESYAAQVEGETKLATVMRQRMGATQDSIKSIVDLTAAQQELGVVGDEVQLAGAQQLATFINQTTSLDTLVPAMDNLIAQQAGYSATTEKAQSIGNLMGKAMQGQVTALRRAGITYTDAEASAMKYGNEQQRAAMLAQIITNNVGQMNSALAQTDYGRGVQLANTFDDVNENAGAAITKISVLFIPALQSLASVLDTVATGAMRVAQAFANVFGGQTAGASSTVSYVSDAADATDDLTDSTEAAAAAQKKLGTFSFDQLQTLSGTSSSSSGSTGTTGTTSSSANMSGLTDSGETVGWLEDKLRTLQSTMASMDFSKLTGSLDNLKDSMAPLNSTLFAGLDWAYNNLFVPLARFTIEKGAPVFINLLAAAASALNAAIQALQPFGSWLWNDFLQPLAAWTGEVIITALEGLTTALNGIATWISNNQGAFQVITGIVAGFIAAWDITGLIQFVVEAGSVVGALSKMTTALFTSIAAKAADRAAAVALAGEYVASLIKNIAASTVEIAKNVVAWISLEAEMIAGKVAAGAAAVAQGALNVATAAGTTAAGAFGAALDFLAANPIVLVIAAVAALALGIYELIKHWDEVKAAASGAWDKITGVWKDASKWFSDKVLDPVTTNFKVWINGLIGYAEGFCNFFIDGINHIITAVDSLSFDIPKWLGGGTFGFNIPTIAPFALPRLATGSVLEPNKPFAAIVGDQTSGVNVESPLATIKDALFDAIDESGLAEIQQPSGAKLTVNGSLAELVRLLQPQLELEYQRVGTHAIKRRRT